ncbi:MAG: hypothetical protein JXA67_05310 [Micromonosporaceae bacterium]|nr:hypothetical protein [Micromonosporaceae bacterium]
MYEYGIFGINQDNTEIRLYPNVDAINRDADLSRTSFDFFDTTGRQLAWNGQEFEWVLTMSDAFPFEIQQRLSKAVAYLLDNHVPLLLDTRRRQLQEIAIQFGRQTLANYFAVLSTDPNHRPSGNEETTTVAVHSAPCRRRCNWIMAALGRC